jgi:hypothetical protein
MLSGIISSHPTNASFHNKMGGKPGGGLHGILLAVRRSSLFHSPGAGNDK